jgi:hypothetical protein
VESHIFGIIINKNIAVRVDVTKIMSSFNADAIGVLIKTFKSLYSLKFGLSWIVLEEVFPT